MPGTEDLLTPESDDQSPPGRGVLPLQPEFSGAGPGSRIKTALGTYGDGPGIDPALLIEDPPFWFILFAWRIRRNYVTAFRKMPREKALKILSVARIPPLCMLALGLRWGFIDRSEFDYLELKTLFDLAGHDTTEFGKELDKQEMRCLYRLDENFGRVSWYTLLQVDFGRFDEDATRETSRR